MSDSERVLPRDISFSRRQLIAAVAGAVVKPDTSRQLLPGGSFIPASSLTETPQSLVETEGHDTPSLLQTIRGIMEQRGVSYEPVEDEDGWRSGFTTLNYGPHTIDVIHEVKVPTKTTLGGGFALVTFNINDQVNDFVSLDIDAKEIAVFDDSYTLLTLSDDTQKFYDYMVKAAGLIDFDQAGLARALQEAADLGVGSPSAVDLKKLLGLDVLDEINKGIMDWEAHRYDTLQDGSEDAEDLSYESSVEEGLSEAGRVVSSFFEIVQALLPFLPEEVARQITWDEIIALDAGETESFLALTQEEEISPQLLPHIEEVPEE